MAMGGGANMPPATQKAVSMYGNMFAVCGGGNIHPIDGKDARMENYFDMWKFSFCKKLSFLSFTFIVVCVNTFFWIFTLIMNPILKKSLDNQIFLGPSLELLNSYGAKNPYEVQQHYQIWRLFTPVVLSVGFSQFFIMNFLLMLIGSMVESYGMGPAKMFALYVVSTVGGELFGSSINYYGSCGCGPAVYGLVACLFTNVIMNWKALDPLEGTGKFCLIFVCIMLFAMTMLMTYQKAIPGQHFERSDVAVNMGGLMAGLFFSLAILPPARPEAANAGSYEKKVSYIGWGLTGVYFLVCSLVFALAAHPTPLRY